MKENSTSAILGETKQMPDTPSETKTALILEGGGCKGAFEAGIIRYISEKGIRIDLVGGSSVGGLNAACFAFDKTADLINLWENIRNSHVYTPPTFANLLSTLEKTADAETTEAVQRSIGLLLDCFKGNIWTRMISALSLYVTARKVTSRLQIGPNDIDTLKSVTKNLLEKNALLDNSPLQRKCEELFPDKKVSDAPIPLFITAFQLQSGGLVYFGRDKNGGDQDAPVVDALLATSAIQGAFPVRMIEEKQYIDGGNGANLPLEYAIRHKCNHIILARDNMPEQSVEHLFRKVWEVVMRSYMASFTNITIRDMKWAGEMTKRIAIVKRNREKLEGFSKEMSDGALKEKYLQTISTLEPVFENKIPIEIIQIVPDWSPTNIVDFSAETSRKLIQAGYEKAEIALKGLKG